MKRRIWKRLGVGVLVCAVLFVGLGVAARRSLKLRRHTVRSPMSGASDALANELKAASTGTPPATIEEAIDLAVKLTGRHLHFGLDHPTRLGFDVIEREANCIEYSVLFTKVFIQIANWAGLKARVGLAHSDEATVFGHTVPLRGWNTHEWAVIEEVDGTRMGRRWYVDATFGDYWLGWNLERNVEEPVPML